jgi:CheY-like chemotaxis protein
VLDIMMPGVDGYGVLRFLAEHELRIPVIAMSANTPSLAEARALGACAALGKPFGLDDLLSIIARNCRHRGAT